MKIFSRTINSRLAYLCAPALCWASIAQVNAASQSSTVFNVQAYGAKGDGSTLDTFSIQAAIDAANQAGGGVVYLPPKRYLSGSLHLKSQVEFRLERGAVLLGSPSKSDYPSGRWSALLEADSQKDFKITGQGTIDGQGLLLARDVMRRAAEGELGAQSAQLQKNRTDSLQLPDSEFSQKTLGIRPNESDRPMIIKFSRCQRAEISGVTVRNSSGWVQHFERCDGLVIRDVKVDSTTYWNNDGIDVTDCRNVKISDCDINSADDGICLKSGASGALGQGDEHSANSPGCYNVDVSNCRVRSSASAFKMGTASFGGFRKIHVANLTIDDTYRSAIALESVDGGTIDDILIENVAASNTGSAIFMRLGQRNKKASPGTFQNVVVRNVKVWLAAGKPDIGYGTIVPSPLSANVLPSAIVGLPGYPMRNVRLENIQIFHPGGGDPLRAQVSVDKLDSVPENAGSYPEVSMFGELPAWGLYVRHAEGLKIVDLYLNRKQMDYRPAMVFDDVRKLTLSALTIKPEGESPEVILHNVHGADFGKPGMNNITPELVQIGPDSSKISIVK